MKSKIGQFFVLGAVVLSALMAPASAQTRSGQVFEDHTKVQKLTGTVLGQQALECPAGSVYSGGACVLISNQSAYGKAWTSYFAGQTKCANSDQQLAWRISGCATIQSDGRILWRVDHAVAPYNVVYSITNDYSGVPYQMDTLTYYTMDGATFRLGLHAGPNLTNEQRLNGIPPTDWALIASSVDTFVDGGSRP